jgi:type IV secretion system protein VirB1
MYLAVLSLLQLLQACAPNVSPYTMAAIVRVESGGNTLAIRDNTIDRTYAPVDAREAEAWANQLLGMGHSLDLGIAQINSANLPRLRLSVHQVFDPCANLHGGATILSEDYAAAAGHFGAGQFALRRAIGAYNSGSLFAGQSYVNEILAAAGLGPETDYPQAQTAATTTQPAATKHHSMSSAPSAGYTVEHTVGSPVSVYVGTP